MTIPSARPFLAKNPIVPVVVLERVADAVPLAKALVAGGITSAEVTFRTEAAADSIKAMAQEVPEITVGAGTVVNRAQAEQAIELGAKFLVSPGWSSEVADVASERELPYLPGIANATDIMATLPYGIDVLKFFPAVPMGGLPVLKALAAPFPQLMFMPTGGVNANNMREWLEYPKIASMGGSWMVAAKLVDAGDFDQVTALSKEALAVVKEVRG